MPTPLSRAARALAALAVCAALSLGAPSAAHAVTAADVAALAGDDFDAKSAAIDHLAAERDAAAVALLNALANGDALATDAGRILVQHGDAARDALTNAPAQAGDAQPVMLNNLLRTKIANALSGLDLASPAIDTRRRAIDALLKSPDAALKPMIDAARARKPIRCSSAASTRYGRSPRCATPIPRSASKRCGSWPRAAIST